MIFFDLSCLYVFRFYMFICFTFAGWNAVCSAIQYNLPNIGPLPIPSPHPMPQHEVGGG